MRLSRIFPGSLLPFLLTAVGFGQAQVWTVDDDGPADYSDIQSAIDNSSDGDAILVKAGTYHGFTLDAKGITIVGASGATNITYTVEVKNLSAGQVVVLSNLDVAPASAVPLTAASNLGSIRLQTCNFVGRGTYTGFPKDGAVFQQCADVCLIDCGLKGGAGAWIEVCDPGCVWDQIDARAGAFIVDSAVALYDCIVQGGQGGPELERDFGGTDGGPGAVVIGSFLSLSKARIYGGQGGTVDDSYYYCSFGDSGDGGAGLDLKDLPSELQRLDSTIQGGGPGNNWACGGWGSDGPDLTGQGSSTLVNLAGTRREMELSAHLQLEGTSVLATFRGEPGDQVFLPVDRGTDFTFDASVKGTWILPQPATIPPTPIVVIPASGEIQAAIPSSTPLGGNEGEVEFRQMYVVSASGDRVLGTPAGTLQIACAGPTTYCTGAPNSVGPGAAISLTGSVSLFAGDAVLHAAAVPPNQFGLFYYGPNQVQLPWGDGYRCAGGGVHRLGTVQSDGSGNALDPLDYTSPPMDAGSGQVVAGGSWNFQYWYRDPNGPGGSGFNASNALAVTFCP